MDLSQLIEAGHFGRWQRESDDEYKVHCPSPTHNDNSPSCFINVPKQVFICFSCGARGHVRKALSWVGLPDVDLGPAQAPTKKLTPTIHVIDDDVLSAWEYEPTAWVREGFTHETLAQHEIGYDFANKRITVPIRDRHGRLVAVSGRADAGQEPRYKIYKQEFGEFMPPGYKAAKGSVLWRHHLLPNRVGHIIVVEGFKAAMYLVQNGHTNVVATMGKNVTEHQLGLLRALRTRVTLMFDGDEAGRKGQDEVGITLYRMGVSVCYADLTDGLSPDDLTGGQLSTALDEALPHMKRRSQHGQPKLDTTSTSLSTPQVRTRHGRRRRRPPL